jgi:hypothetical protein
MQGMNVDDAPKTCQNVSDAMGLPAERVVRLLRGLSVISCMAVEQHYGFHAIECGRGSSGST